MIHSTLVNLAAFVTKILANEYSLDCTYTNHDLPYNLAGSGSIYRLYHWLWLTIQQLGPSALAGFVLFLIVGPVQERAMEQQHRIRKASTIYTEQRANTILEILGNRQGLNLS
jgi:hypothetical protein